MRKKKKQSTRWRRIVALGLAVGAIALLATRSLRQAPEVVEAPPRVPLHERTAKVLLIGIDGVRPDVLTAVETPNIDALSGAGTMTARTTTTTPSVSGPAWSSMLTGVWPEKHGVTNNDYTDRNFGPYPDFLTRLELINPSYSTFAAIDWLPLVHIEGDRTLLSEQIDSIVEFDGYELGWAEADEAVASAAARVLRLSDPDAAFVYLGTPDEVSHQNGSIGNEYRQAITLADRHVGLLINAIRARPTFGSENWLVVISTDHGRTTEGGHGGDSPEEMTTFIVVSGQTATMSTPDGPSFIVDIVPTLLQHLGIEVDPGWELDGVPLGMRGP